MGLRIAIKLVACLLGATVPASMLAAPAAWATPTAAPAPGTVKVDNKLAGISDVVTVSGLAAGDTVRVYADEAGAVLLGSALVAAGAASASVSVAELGAGGGYVYVTVTRPPYSESRRTIKSFAAEPASAALPAASVYVANEPVGTPDKVIVRGLATGSLIKVYKERTGGAELASAYAAASGSAEVAIAQLGEAAGYVYVTVTEAGKRESARVQKAYAGEALTPSPTTDTIRIDNAVNGSPDTVTVFGLKPADIVTLYADDKTAVSLGSAVVPAGSVSASVVTPQLGAAAADIYVTVTSPPRKESVRVSKRFRAEPVSPAPLPGTIIVRNAEPSVEDEVEVYGLAEGDRVAVYADGTQPVPLASATVTAGRTSAIARIAQVGREEGRLYVAVTKSGMLESARTSVAYAAEGASKPPDASQIRVTNHSSGTNDTVEVTGVQAGDTVRVYGDRAAVSPIASAVTASGLPYATAEAAQLGEQEGVVFVTVQRGALDESARVAKSYGPERQTPAPAPGTILIVNETAGTADRIMVTGLAPGYTVRLYSGPDDSAAAATGIVPAGAAAADITVAQLGQNGGTAYVTVQSPGKTESIRTAKAFAEEGATLTPSADAIAVVNRAKSSDTVTVGQLAPGDMVSVYADASSAVAMGQATVAAGATSASVNLVLPGAAAGVVYVAASAPAKRESARTAKLYAVEPVSMPPSARQITVTNRSGGTDGDEVTVSGLKQGDTVRLYEDAAVSTVMSDTQGREASATAAAGSAYVTIGSLRLDSAGGTIYVTVEAADAAESARTVKMYSAE